MKTPLLIVTLILCSFQISYSKTIVILFGGATGFKYSPDSVEANVGDIIHWEGSFPSHPLVSTFVPAGANSISVSIGTTFDYSITHAGDYRFMCDVHSFKGVVKASAAAGIVTPEIPEPIMFFSSECKTLNFKNLSQNKTSQVYIFNETGQSIYNAVLCPSENLPLHTSLLKNGIYTACLIAENRKSQYCRFMVAD